MNNLTPRFQGGDYDNCCLLECDAVQSGACVPTNQTKFLSPSGFASHPRREKSYFQFCFIPKPRQNIRQVINTYGSCVHGLLYLGNKVER